MGAPAVLAATPAAADEPPAIGCAVVVPIQNLSFTAEPIAAHGGGALLPDDGGMEPPVVRLAQRRVGDVDELVLLVGIGPDARTLPVYSAPSGCGMRWNRQVHPWADAGGRRSAHIPAFTLRQVPTRPSTCPPCLRPV